VARILITGASRGIGAALAVVLAERGHEVIRTMRKPAPGDTGGRVLALDVSDGESIAALAAALADQPLDVLVNNAGIFGYRGAGLGKIDDTVWHEVFATNVIGAYRVTEALLPQLRAGRERKIVTVSSRMGSMGANTSGGEYIYRSSKAAVNAVMRSLAVDLAREAFIVALAHPGWVRSDMGGANAAIDARTSAVGLARLIEDLSPEQSGGFFNYDGTALVW
jgi:NAD(P)-dependent dehydrogenase (short-subunit alcohol dehydrogenase family)